MSDVDEDGQGDQGQANATRKRNGKAKAPGKGVTKGKSNKTMKIAAHGIKIRSERVQSIDKGKEKSSYNVMQTDKGREKLSENVKKYDKGKEKLFDTSESRKNSEKGKNTVGGERSGVGEEDHAEEEPSFGDRNYHLNDHDEDAIMDAQVEGWNKVVDVMATHPMDRIGDTNDSDQLPSHSPSSRTEDEKDMDNDSDKHLSRRYKAATDINYPRLEVGMWFNCKEDFNELICHQGVVQGKKLRLKKND